MKRYLIEVLYSHICALKVYERNCIRCVCAHVVLYKHENEV